MYVKLSFASLDLIQPKIFSKFVFLHETRLKVKLMFFFFSNNLFIVNLLYVNLTSKTVEKDHIFKVEYAF